MSTGEQLLALAHRMALGEVGALEELRKKIIVDMDLNDFLDEEDTCLVASIYIAKRLTDDIWYNLALDASFDFPIDQLSNVTKLIGKALLAFLKPGNDTEYNLSALLGSAIKETYLYFRWIGDHPTDIKKGGAHGLAAKSG